MINGKAYAEVYYIIGQLSDEMQSKIPIEIQKKIEQNMDKDYAFQLENADLENIKLLDDTERILSVLYTDYLSTPEERMVILEKEKLLKMKNEIQKKREYHPDDVFSGKKEELHGENEKSQQLIKMEKKNIFQKISEKIKNFFRILWN